MIRHSPKYRWLQFSLRMLLIVVTLCAIPCSWLGWKIREADRLREQTKRQREAAGKILFVISYFRPFVIEFPLSRFSP